MPKTFRIDWNQPLFPSVTRRLLAEVKSEACLDLSHITVIVPTVQSGRRLRETLAISVADQSTGLFPPEILTADQLLANVMPISGLANRTTQLTAWALVLQNIDTEAYAAVFPKAPNRSSAWLLGMAERFAQLRTELGEAGLDFQAVADTVESTPYEPLRWKQLAELEALYYRILDSQTLQDPIQTRRQLAAEFQLPKNTKRILVICSPDPQPLPVQALQRIDQTMPVEVWIYGPTTEDALFDEWGRPTTELWQTRDLDFEAWACRIETTGDPLETASRVAESVKGQAPEAVAIGLADPGLNPVVADRMLQAGIPYFDPSGEAVLSYDLGQLTQLLSTLNTRAPAVQIRSCLSHPDLWQWLQGQLHVSASQSGVLKQLDHLIEAHLAPDLPTLMHFAAQAPAYANIDQALKILHGLALQAQDSDHFARSLTVALQEIYQQKKLGKDENIWKEQAAAIRHTLEESDGGQTLHERLPPHFAAQSFLRDLKSTRTYPDRPRDAHDLLGWLELLWNDAPYLLIAGLNEGIVPESVGADAFLPEPLREHLGLRTNAQRFARDAYLLEALCRRRANAAGRVDILIQKTAGDQTPLKPSRLLFLGNESTLIPRTRLAFKETASPSPLSQYNPAWKLSPPPGIPLPTSLSVSSLKNYLECPFRFFLRHILKMRPLEIESRELTPAKFGTLLHDSLSHLKGRRLSASTSESELAKEIEKQIDASLTKQYGHQLSFALRLQREALQTRGLAFAQKQIEDLQIKGSIQIKDTEYSFEMPISECRIRGQIDRIDQCESSLELIDYKTADTPKSPEKAHLALIGRKEPPAHLPDAAFFEHNGKRYRWIDLQLPLYVLSQKGETSTRPSLAYFNLAKTIDKSAIERWDNLTDSHLDAALACAKAIIGQIQKGIFWPPNPDVREEYDEFAAYFPDGIEKSVHAEAFAQYQFSTEENA